MRPAAPALGWKSLDDLLGMTCDELYGLCRRSKLSDMTKVALHLLPAFLPARTAYSNRHGQTLKRAALEDVYFASAKIANMRSQA